MKIRSGWLRGDLPLRCMGGTTVILDRGLTLLMQPMRPRTEPNRPGAKHRGSSQRERFAPFGSPVVAFARRDRAQGAQQDHRRRSGQARGPAHHAGRLKARPESTDHQVGMPCVASTCLSTARPALLGALAIETQVEARHGPHLRALSGPAAPRHPMVAPGPPRPSSRLPLVARQSRATARRRRITSG